MMPYAIQKFKFTSVHTLASSVAAISSRNRSKSFSLFHKKRRLDSSYPRAALLTGLMLPGSVLAGDGDLNGLFFGAIAGFILAVMMMLIVPVKPLVKLIILFPLAFILAWPCGYFAAEFFGRRLAERNATYDSENHCYKSSLPARAGDYPNCK